MADIYSNGIYHEHNPTWHEEDSPWKAKQIIKIIENNSLHFNTICEVGCGAGEILNQLSNRYPEMVFFGYEISPQAFEISKKKKKVNLNFYLIDLLKENNTYFDIVMAIDVFEHVEDYFGFLRKLKVKGVYKIFHIPLDLSVQSILRSNRIISGRQSVGHIHYFTKETALETLKDTGYEIIDYFYTNSALELSNLGWKANLISPLRNFGFALNRDLTVRILGGYSLLVLAK